MGCGSSRALEPSVASQGFSKEGTVIRNNAEFQKFYTLEKKLGLGTLSEVWKVKKKSTEKLYSVKIIKRTNKKHANTIDKLVNTEVDMLAKLDSPNILRIIEIYEDKYKYYIITELLTGPSLLHHISKEKENINENIVAGYIKQILSGLSVCHAEKVIHRDIRPEKIIFADENLKTLKLVDFKFSKIFDESNKRTREVFGTAAYIAPEILDKGMYSDKSDIWSCGVMTYFLLSGTFPFKVNTKTSTQNLLADLYCVITENKFTMDNFKGEDWEKISLLAKNFLLRMLDINPSTRSSALDLLKDPWLSDICKSEISPTESAHYLLNLRNNIVPFSIILGGTKV